ncbi:PREDICTED: uncharacterized protein LOC104763497 [Camelina sativa]|uniref:Uncharacterized protein LOC104763497 n=1 Tax=Camelina sativa TaxID=90675 RepID=A0ABM0XFD7_CAMSA|nr:PREDICTED: uncharacterized protein LOC104763497 [Camelina sativa]
MSETPPFVTPSSQWGATTPRTTPNLDGIEQPLHEWVRIRLSPSCTSPWTWFGAICCFLFSIGLLICGITTLILIFAVRPRIPVLDVANASQNTILFESPVFSGDIVLQLNFTNPNKKQVVRFEDIQVELLFSEKVIAKKSLLPFSLRNGQNRLESIGLVSDSILLPVNVMIELGRKVASNLVDYEIKSIFRVNAVLGFVPYSYMLHGTCHIQLTGPPGGGLVSRNCTTNR